MILQEWIDLLHKQDPIDTFQMPSNEIPRKRPGGANFQDTDTILQTQRINRLPGLEPTQTRGHNHKTRSFGAGVTVKRRPIEYPLGLFHLFQKDTVINRDQKRQPNQRLSGIKGGLRISLRHGSQSHTAPPMAQSGNRAENTGDPDLLGVLQQPLRHILCLLRGGGLQEGDLGYFGKVP